MHGIKRRRRPSRYAEHLLEKQKARAISGVNEGQFRRYLEASTHEPGRPGDNLLRRLELRLDNVVNRLGMARTRPMARQLVSHRHVSVSGEWVNIPSYRVKAGDTIGLSEDAQKFAPVAEALAHPTTEAPAWLERQGATGRIRATPGPGDFEPHINPDLIVEFYSR